jgi:hypothetical protein
MKLITTLLFSFIISTHSFAAKANGDPEVYLLTILPGKEIYSIYGHSALRVVIPERNIDQVFNWGVFDFNTPNFGYQFAKGRLNYMLATYSYERFLQEYFLEQRTVISQKLLLTSQEKDLLIKLAFENLQPENLYYLYDFFYDNCATRIRDIIQKSVDGKIILPENRRKFTPTFRELLDKYQKPYRWLDLGIDLLLGLPADNKASANEQMFLPDYLMSNLTDATVERTNGISDLLDDPVIVYDFDAVPVISNRFTSPMFVLWTLLGILLVVSLSNIKMKWMRRIDIVIFSIYSALAILMIFSNFFTSHGPMKWNLNLIWLSPLLVVTLLHLVAGIKKVYWYRFNLTVTALFLVLSPLIPQSLNRYMVPLLLILVVRLFFLSAFGKTASR